MPGSAFFGFPSEPHSRVDAVIAAVARLGESGLIAAVPWTHLQNRGRVVIDAITDAIDACSLAAFDVTDLNTNVWFEVGYAIGHAKRVWLMRDDTDVAARRDWQRLKLLTTIGYTPFVNSEDIVADFMRTRPDQIERTIYETAIVGSLEPAHRATILYVPSLHETEAGRLLTRRLNRERDQGLSMTVDDPDEAAVRPLAWYAQQIYSSVATVVHFTSPRRSGANVHNARCSLVAGLARGMDRPLFMLADTDFAPPIDYRDFLFVYGTANSAVRELDEWLDRYRDLLAPPEPTPTTSTTHRRLDVELRSLRLGDPVAENEAEALPEYFVETAAYDEVIERKTAIFVGRKGTGKTANMLTAANDLAADRRNVVVVVKPHSYELEGLLELIRGYREISEQGYLTESIWKFLLLTSIASEVARQLQQRPAGAADDPVEREFLEFVDSERALFDPEFATRLDLAVRSLLESPQQTGLADRRQQISEALHERVLGRLTRQLERVLAQKYRVAVLVDNLDKAWVKNTDVGELSHFVLGLLGSIGRVSDELSRSRDKRRALIVTVAVFLRGDIFSQVLSYAREPDKIQSIHLNWGDPNQLRRIVEERYAAPRRLADGHELWERFFCPMMNGRPTSEYLLYRSLPRPRDFIYLCSAAIASAANRSAPIVGEVDIKSAEKAYSQFALEALLVENGMKVAELESVLLEFLGGPPLLAVGEVKRRIVAAGVAAMDVETTLEHLYELSFLGVEAGDGRFRYSQDFTVDTLVKPMLRQDDRTLVIHPAFRPYLEIEDEPTPGRS
jgi:hypothetical protein